MDMLPLEDSRKHGTEHGAEPAVQASAEPEPIEQAGRSGAERIHPATVAYIEEMERSRDASERELAAKIREEIGLPPARRS